MLESIRKNRKHIFRVVTVGLFGIMGLFYWLSTSNL